MNFDSMQSVFEDQLQDLYNAEQQVEKALPKMMKACGSDTLRKAFEEHRKQTQGQLKRLEEIGKQAGIKLSGKKCKAMEGLIEEGKEVLEAKGEHPYVDIALVAAAQRVEHYEISAYGTARTLAQQMGEDEIAEMLQQTLEEEEATDERLTQICEEELFADAADVEEAEVDEAEEEELDLEEGMEEVEGEEEEEEDTDWEEEEEPPRHSKR